MKEKTCALYSKELIIDCIHKPKTNHNIIIGSRPSSVPLPLCRSKKKVLTPTELVSSLALSNLPLELTILTVLPKYHLFHWHISIATMLVLIFQISIADYLILSNPHAHRYRCLISIDHICI